MLHYFSTLQPDISIPAESQMKKRRIIKYNMNIITWLFITTRRSSSFQAWFKGTHEKWLQRIPYKLMPQDYVATILKMPVDNRHSRASLSSPFIFTYLIGLFVGGRHFGGEFPQEILGAPHDGRTSGSVVCITCKNRTGVLFPAILFSRALFVLREQLALLLEELRFAEALFETGGALQGRRRARGRARKLELVS